MKAIDSMWFNTISGVCGIVLGENDMGERKLYGGVCLGHDQKADEQVILEHGSKINITLLQELINKAKKV